MRLNQETLCLLRRVKMGEFDDILGPDEEEIREIGCRKILQTGENTFLYILNKGEVND